MLCLRYCVFRLNFLCSCVLIVIITFINYVHTPAHTQNTYICTHTKKTQNTHKTHTKHIHMYTHKHTHAHTQNTYICTHTNTHMHTHKTHTYVHTQTHTCTHTHTHIKPTQQCTNFPTVRLNSVRLRATPNYRQCR